MKKAVVLLIILFPLLAHAQDAALLQEFITTSPVKPTAQQTDRLNLFIERLQKKEAKSDVHFLKSIFKKTHQKFLKSYSQYADLGEVFQTGKFDCLTATALFSLVLDQTHFDYKIIETNYHIFILVNTSKGQVLLETTDRLTGFVDNNAEISKRISTYQQNEIAKDNADRYYHYSFDLFHEVRPTQLTGLLLFNQAVKAYNQHDLLQCASLLEQSKEIYESPRIEELAAVLIRSVLESSLPTAAKSKVLQRYKNVIMSKNSPIASL